MMAWFATRPPRERALILVALVLGLGAVIWLFGVVPLREAKATAALSHASAARAHDVVIAARQQALLQREREMAGGSAPAAGVASGNLRTLVVQSARTAGLPLTRIQGDTEGAVSLTFEAVDPPLLFGFLLDLESRFGVVVQRASLTQDPDGTVRAVVEFGGGEG